jgi:molybdopterin molybdotransferase
MSLRHSLGRITLEAVESGISVPSFDNSAMDGYALRAADVGTPGASLRVVGRSFAGAPFEGELQPGEAVRIMTGAVMPKGGDAVVMQEYVCVDGERIRIDRDSINPGANVRYAGEDFKPGHRLVEAGTRLGPANIGLLASAGVDELSVRRQLRVAYFSTGDELRRVGHTLQSGQIYDSNRYLLDSLLRERGIQPIDLGVIPDDRHAIRGAFRHAADMADAIITSGGVSVGEADYIKETLDELGEVGFWRIAMKPGKPLAFGRIDDAVFFGLPGNPVSTMVTFYQFAWPALRKMMGMSPAAPLLLEAKTTGALKKSPGRMEFQRGRLLTNDAGELLVTSTGSQGSHILTSMTEADCFILLDSACAGVDAGGSVRVQPFANL